MYLQIARCSWRETSGIAPLGLETCWKTYGLCSWMDPQLVYALVVLSLLCASSFLRLVMWGFYVTSNPVWEEFGKRFLSKQQRVH